MITQSHTFAALIRLSTTTHNLLTFNTTQISSDNSEKLSLLAADRYTPLVFTLTLVLFKFPDVEPHGRQTSVESDFTPEKSKGCVFWGESKNGFVISDHTDSSLPKKRMIRKRIIYHDNGISPCSSSKKKNNNKLIFSAKGKRKSNISYESIYIRNVYISV